jgi:NAD-dependent dihydropyrimidine dehydrogenase PreA subunit
MVLRKFIEIDEDKCNGCGNCVVDCAEGALQIIDGKARVIKEEFCDGLGACLGRCPTDALKIIDKDVAEFNEKAVEEHLKNNAINKNHQKPCPPSGGCPSTQYNRAPSKANVENESNIKGTIQSQLQQWPIQLHLLNPSAPYLAGANFLLAATCSAFSYGNFHNDFIKNHIIAIACPKLDNTEPYLDKLVQIIQKGGIASITVIRMEVPCCSGLSLLVKKAIEKSGKKLPYLEEIVSISGEIK